MRIPSNCRRFGHRGQRKSMPPQTSASMFRDVSMSINALTTRASLDVFCEYVVPPFPPLASRLSLPSTLCQVGRVYLYRVWVSWDGGRGVSIPLRGTGIAPTLARWHRRYPYGVRVCRPRRRRYGSDAYHNLRAGRNISETTYQYA